MTEFIPIKEANDSHKGNIRGVIIKESDLKAGTGRGGDWTMKVFTMEDTSGQVDITCWNTETGRLQVGQYYEIEKPWWKERTDKPGEWNLGLGEYCKINKIDNPPTQTKTPTEEVPAHGQVPPEQKTTIPALETAVETTVGANTLLMVQIEHKVRAVLTDLTGKNPDNAQVGLYTKMNFYFLKGIDAKD